MTAPLPFGWIAQYDIQMQRYYYVETASGRTQWEDPRDLIPMALYSSPHQPYQAHQSDNNMLGHHAQLSHGNSHPGPAVLIEHKHEHEYGSSKGHKDHGLFSLFQNKGYKNGRNGKNSISSLFQDKPRKDGKKDKDKDNDKDDRKDKFCKHGKESQDCKKCKDKEAEDEIIEEIVRTDPPIEQKRTKGSRKTKDRF